MTPSSRRVIASIHDVWPETLAPVEELLAWIQRHQQGPVMLLVTPGKPWREADLDRLRRWQSQGHPLAAHGWHHRAREVTGWSHRLHSTMISRGLAEHLALESREIVELVHRSFEWFAENDLPAPRWYVPPAWAMGRLTREQWTTLPCRFFETLSGVYDNHTGRRWWLPLTGFEADTRGRAFFLSLFNAANLSLSRLTGRPARLAIHPHDLSYRLGEKLRRFLQQPMTLCRMEDLVSL